ncbi:MAG: CdaR family transcriptional regulator [Bacillota bacterium]
MEITHQYAQSIVDMTMKVLNHNINIMDQMGVIVASGDTKRLNSFHQGAAEVIKTGKAMEITSEQAQRLEGAKPGVNLPIYLNDKIAGVVGITGDPNEVRPFGELLKISVETMLQQAFLMEQLRMEQNAKELYIRDIISGNFGDDEEIFMNKGSLLGFDMAIPRVAVVIKIYGLIENTFNGLKPETLSDKENRKMGLKLQKRRENILNFIKTAFNNPQNMISSNGSDHFIIFYATRKTSPDETRKAVVEAIDNVQTKMGKFNITSLTGIGLYYPGVTGLKKSYDDAIQTIYISERLKNSEYGSGNIASTADFGLEMILINHLSSFLTKYIDLFTRKNESHNNIVEQPKLLQTLKVFFGANLNQSVTAKKLNISRNTLTNRLDKITNQTGYDPRNFNDAVRLKLFVLINELRK